MKRRVKLIVSMLCSTRIKKAGSMTNNRRMLRKRSIDFGVHTGGVNIYVVVEVVMQ